MKEKSLAVDKDLINQAIDLATRWQDRACLKISHFENSFHAKMQKLLNNPMDKVFLIELMDQSFRSHDVSRVENQIDYLFSKYGMATFFTSTERFLIFLFQHMGAYIPRLSIPLFVENIRSDTRKVVLPAEDKFLNRHLQSRRLENSRVNLNLIGEIVLGEAEAQTGLTNTCRLWRIPTLIIFPLKFQQFIHRSIPFPSSKQLMILFPGSGKYF